MGKAQFSLKFMRSKTFLVMARMIRGYNTCEVWSSVPIGTIFPLFLFRWPLSLVHKGKDTFSGNNCLGGYLLYLEICLLSFLANLLDGKWIYCISPQWDKTGKNNNRLLCSKQITYAISHRSRTNIQQAKPYPNLDASPGSGTQDESIGTNG